MSKNLLEEAIAEAKTIRETAIANAREALTETMTPHFKSMITAKLEEEFGQEEDEFGTEDIHADGMTEVEDPTGEEGMDPEEELPAEEPIEEPDLGGEEGMEDDREIGDLSVDEFKDLLKDLLGQMTGEELPAEEPIEEPDPEGEEGMEMEPEGEMQEPGMETGEEEEEEISLDELLREMDQEDETLYESRKKTSAELGKTQKELRSTKVQLSEALRAVKKLQGELQEINLLNAKLLYTTKILKATSLSESQKVDIVTAFDSADTIKEAKLIYQTVSNRILQEGKRKAIRKPITENVRRGMASQSTSTPKVTPPAAILSESDKTVRRLQQLAGILKD